LEPVFAGFFNEFLRPSHAIIDVQNKDLQQLKK
jgi:hypothetical protein